MALVMLSWSESDHRSPCHNVTKICKVIKGMCDKMAELVGLLTSVAVTSPRRPGLMQTVLGRLYCRTIRSSSPALPRNLLIRHYCLSQSQMSEDAKVRPASAVDLEVHAAEKKPRLDGDQAVGNANTLDKKSRTRKTKRKQKFLQPEAGSMEDVLFHEVTSLLGRDVVDEAMRSGTERQSPFEYMEIVELTISSLSSSGTFFSLHPILADALEDGGSTRWFSFQRCLVKLQGSELSAT